MAYKLSIKNGDTIYTGVTLGNAFTALDNWCYENKGVYGLGNIYHEFDNQIGIDVYLKNNVLKQFSIVMSN